MRIFDTKKEFVNTNGNFFVHLKILKIDGCLFLAFKDEQIMSIERWIDLKHYRHFYENENYILFYGENIYNFPADFLKPIYNLTKKEFLVSNEELEEILTSNMEGVSK